jgi:hypothetical protein
MNCLWWPCLLTNLDEMNNLYSNLPYRVIGPCRLSIACKDRQLCMGDCLYRGPSRMLPTKFLFILLSSFRGDFFLEIYQPETSMAHDGHAC